jgi:hypothetical protein
MRVKLIFVDRDRMNRHKVIREEFLQGESKKPLTKNRVSKMVKRFHPELRTSGVIDVSRFEETSDLNVDWLVHVEQLGPNSGATSMPHECRMTFRTISPHRN